MYTNTHAYLSFLAYCPHSKKLVGYAQDAFDMDVIAKEFQKRYTSTPEDDEDAMDVDENEEKTTKKLVKTDENKLPLGKHYTVFTARTWTSKSRPFNFVVARYCLASLSGRWVRINKRQITSTLAFFNFYVNANSFDGATENRSAMNQDLTLSLRVMLPELYVDRSEHSEVLGAGCDEWQ